MDHVGHEVEHNLPVLELAALVAALDVVQQAADLAGSRTVAEAVLERDDACPRSCEVAQGEKVFLSELSVVVVQPVSGLEQVRVRADTVESNSCTSAFGAGLSAW